MKKKKIKSVELHVFDKKTNVIFNVLLALFALSCILPFIFVIIISITDESSLMTKGYSFYYRY